MFRLVSIEDNVRVHPLQFDQDKYDALEDAINRRYCDKVIPNVGLCLGFFDWIRVEDERLVPGDGGSYTRCRFRMTVFEPFVGEVITGRIASCSKSNGLRVSLEFFHDIIVPPGDLPDPSVFDDTDGVWVWKYDGNDLYMDCQELLRFKVKSVSYVEEPEKERENALQNAAGGNPPDPGSSAMVVQGLISEDGLGLTNWWDS